MSVYYNDNEPFVCAWMQNLMDAGLIAQGKIDSRPIQEVKADEVRDYKQCHWFAGIAGWQYALQLAGYPDLECWTASLPCQPFSVAGRQKAERDDRHLWPVFYDLVCQCRPVTIFGEQVEAAVRLGWIDRVRADLDRAGYAFGFVVLGAHSVGAPHIRQRIYWVAHTGHGSRCTKQGNELQERDGGAWESGGGLPDSPGRRVSEPETTDRRESSTGSGELGDAKRLGLSRIDGRGTGKVAEDGRERMGDSLSAGSQGRGLQLGQRASERTAWASGAYIQCADGKARLIEPSICPLAHGVPNRVGALRGAGNSIVPQVAAEFIKAFMDGDKGAGE